MSPNMHTYWVYILAGHSHTLYIGMTSSLESRVYQHKHKLRPGFTSNYNVDRLVYIEEYSDVYEAMARERQLKGWRRAKKIELIESANPGWHDLSADWYAEE